MSWRFVMDSAMVGDNKSDYARIVFNAGYKFFVFNNEVCFVANDAHGLMVYPTGIEKKDLF